MNKGLLIQCAVREIKNKIDLDSMFAIDGSGTCYQESLDTGAYEVVEQYSVVTIKRAGLERNTPTNYLAAGCTYNSWDGSTACKQRIGDRDILICFGSTQPPQSTYIRAVHACIFHAVFLLLLRECIFQSANPAFYN
jgi:hypothetical protein